MHDRNIAPAIILGLFFLLIGAAVFLILAGVALVQAQ